MNIIFYIYLSCYSCYSLSFLFWGRNIVFILSVHHKSLYAQLLLHFKCEFFNTLDSSLLPYEDLCCYSILIGVLFWSSYHPFYFEYLENFIPYLGLHNAQDFAQILYFVGGVRIINRSNVFHSFPDQEITCPPCFFVYYRSVRRSH